MVTAEHKTNKYGSRYVYYHCTKRMDGPRCPERSIDVKQLEAQILAFLTTLRIEPSIEAWIDEQLALEVDFERDLEAAQKRSVAQSITAAQSELRELTGLRTRSLIGDDEFVRERERLTAEIALLSQRLSTDTKDRFELFRKVASFNVLAVVWFLEGSDEDRRLILQIVGSNSTLKDKKLSIQAAKPFVEVAKLAKCLRVRGDEEDVLQNDVSRGRLRDSASTFSDHQEEPISATLLADLRALHARMSALQSSAATPPLAEESADRDVA